MKTFGLLVALLMCLAGPAQAQDTGPPDGTTISGVSVSGLDRDRLSPGLRADIDKLAGTPLDRRALTALATRIEGEQPRYLAAIRTTAEPDGTVRVVFVVGRIRDQGREPNINDKYIVEDVEIRGVPDRDLTAQIENDRQALTGKPLDSDAADRLGTLLKDAFPKYDVSRRVTRGNQSGRLKVIYDLQRSEVSRWLRFEPMTPTPSAVYHSDQGWGAFLPVGFNSRDLKIAPIFAFDHSDDLIEEILGFGVHLESRRLGTERLGASFEWTTYDLDWRAQTVTALALNPQIPGMYRNRATVTPQVRFAITPRLSIGGGVSIAELDPLEVDPISEDPLPDLLPSRMANAFVGSVSFNQGWKPSFGARHDLEAAFTVRAGSRTLESDLVYERYLGSADYLVRWRHQSVAVSGMVGRIDGNAPLFERFAAGDSRTLRGWDKYAIWPAGGNRMFYISGEYEYRGLALFLDAGSVWDAGTERRTRVSAGFGYHPGPVFFTVGVPLNTDELTAVFTMGLRFSPRFRKP
jgi:surface antigen Omp85-like protein